MRGRIIMNKIFFNLLAIILMGCYVGGNMGKNYIEPIKIAIYPSSGGLSETYYFEINSKNELISETGTRISDDLSQTPFINKNGTYSFQSESKKLTFSEANYVIALADKIYEDNTVKNDGIILDSWEIRILYHDKTFICYYLDDKFPQIKELVDEIIRLSPIEVDLHGWA